MLKQMRTFPRRPHLSADHIAWIVVLSSLILIVQATLTPYHFQFAEVLREHTPMQLIADFLSGVSDPADMINNVVGFLPFGFGLALLFERQQRPVLVAFAATVMMGAGLSLAVELLQLFLPTRTATPFDVMTNTLGTFLGWFSFQGLRLTFRSPSYLMITLVLYLLVANVASIPLQSATQLTNWDPTFRLLIGNDRTGAAPWKGQIFDLAIADTALDERQVQALLQNQPLPATIDDQFIAAYRFAGGGSYPDRTGTLPNLVWRKNAPGAQVGTGLTLSSGNWLETQSPAAPLTRKLAESSQFTLITTVRSADPQQDYSAQIISLSGNLSHGNFTLGQEQDHLTFYLRTPTSGDNVTHMPELFVPDVFTDTRPHNVIITYDRGIFQFYIDGVRRPHRMVITPEFVLFGYLIPPQIQDLMQHQLLSPDERYVVVYKLLYYCLVFVPLGLLLTLVSRWVMAKLPIRLRLVVMLAATIVPTTLFEVELALTGGRALESRNLLLGIVLTACSWVFFHVRIVSAMQRWSKRLPARSDIATEGMGVPPVPTDQASAG